MSTLRVAVIGHLQHITMGTVPALPAPGDIVHLEAPLWFPGGGGGVAFFQLARSPAEVHLFTAVGDDTIGAAVLARATATGAAVHAVRRPQPHARDVTLLTPDGERTIIVIDEPLHPRADDPLPWDVLDGCDAVFYTAYDPAVLRRARAARLLVVTARRRPSLIEAGVRADIVVGSGGDPRERSRRADYPTPPAALVMTDGARGGWVESAAGEHHFDAAPPPPAPHTTYGAGDTFAAALTWFAATGLAPLAACERAAVHAAAVLAGPNPLVSQRPLPPPAAG